MRSRAFRSFGPLAALLVALGTPAGALAHPHVWIDTMATLQFDQGQRIVSIKAGWLFDEIYSAYAVEGLDTDGDGRYAPGELKALAAENVSQLQEWGYFTVLKAGGDRVALGPVSDYAMTYEGGRLALVMTLPLARPLDPRQAPVTFAMFDPTFYIELVPVKDEPVRFDGGAPQGCAARLESPATDEPSYVPDAVAQAAEVDPAEPENSIGAGFADWVTLACSGPS